MSEPITGIDVSAYQAPPFQKHHVDWEAVKAAGHAFAYVKATEGTGYTNAAFAWQWAGAKGAGLIRGAYHFLRWEKGSPSGVRQADHFARTVGQPTPGDLPPMLDCEWIKGQKADPLAVVTKARDWLEQVERLMGVQPGIYVGPAFWRYCMLPAGRPAIDLTSWPLWVVDYQPPLDPMAGVSWRPIIHQHTGSGSCPGVEGACDLNRWLGTMEELRLLACLGGNA